MDVALKLGFICCALPTLPLPVGVKESDLSRKPRVADQEKGPDPCFVGLGALPRASGPSGVSRRCSVRTHKDPQGMYLCPANAFTKRIKSFAMILCTHLSTEFFYPQIPSTNRKKRTWTASHCYIHYTCLPPHPGLTPFKTYPRALTKFKIGLSGSRSRDPPLSANPKTIRPKGKADEAMRQAHLSLHELLMRWETVAAKTVFRP